MARKLKPVEAEVEHVEEEITEAVEPVTEQEELEGDFLPIPENLEELIEQANKSPLAEGTYLAALLSVEGKLNESTLSYGYWWKWLVNASPFEDGWDGEGKTFEVRQYTYLGKLKNGKLEQTSGGFSATNVLSSLGVTDRLNTEQVRGKQAVVQIKHRQDNIDPSRTFMEVAKTFPYTQNGVKAPVLKFVKESKPAAAAPRPAASSDPEW